MKLENGLVGTIFNRDISATTEITDPTSRMKRDQVVTGRVIHINFERGFVNISTKSDVLQDNQGLYKLKDDDYTNSDLKEKVLNEYKKKTGSDQKVPYIKVSFKFFSGFYEVFDSALSHTRISSMSTFKRQSYGSNRKTKAIVLFGQVQRVTII